MTCYYNEQKFFNGISSGSSRNHGMQLHLHNTFNKQCVCRSTRTIGGDGGIGGAGGAGGVGGNGGSNEVEHAGGGNHQNANGGDANGGHGGNANGGNACHNRCGANS